MLQMLPPAKLLRWLRASFEDPPSAVEVIVPDYDFDSEEDEYVPHNRHGHHICLPAPLITLDMINPSG